MYKIEDDVPIERKGISELTKVALLLQVGQSFVVPVRQQQTYGHLKTAAKRGMKFKTRKETDTTTRIWRIA